MARFGAVLAGNNTLLILDLSIAYYYCLGKNKITDKGASCIAEGLKLNSALTTLHLGIRSLLSNSWQRDKG